MRWHPNYPLFTSVLHILNFLQEIIYILYYLPVLILSLLDTPILMKNVCAASKRFLSRIRSSVSMHDPFKSKWLL
jgi:hypothetical protein